MIPSKQYEKSLKMPKSKIPKTKQTELEEITKLLEEQNPKDLNAISDLTVKLLNEYKHLIKQKKPNNSRRNQSAFIFS
jgi:hypothetical protein